MNYHSFDPETHGIKLTNDPVGPSSEIRPVWPAELNLYGLQNAFDYDPGGATPVAWAEANRILYDSEPIVRIGFERNTDGGRFLPEVLKPGRRLDPVDVGGMVEKNRAALDALYQKTVDDLAADLRTVREKTSSFLLSFSGGKDSAALFFIVEKFREQNTDFLTRENFDVIFSDTDMESRATYAAVKAYERIFKKRDINFHRAKFEKPAEETWAHFGPPSRPLRWCCTVHKTTPILLLHRDIMLARGFKSFATCSFVGVRASESARRAKYKRISSSHKSRGDVCINTIIAWSSADVWLCLLDNGLPINEDYKAGCNRVGCELCPMSSDRASLINKLLNPAGADRFKKAFDAFYSVAPEASKGWRARYDAIYNANLTNGVDATSDDEKVVLKLGEFRQNPRELLKIVDAKETTTGAFEVNRLGRRISFTLVDNVATITRDHTRRGNSVLSQIRKLLTRAVYCVACRACEVNCPRGAISFDGEKMRISDDCIHCGECLKGDDACLAYKCRYVSSYREKKIARLRAADDTSAEVCFDCSKKLEADEVGATLKLLGRSEKRRFCASCLGRRLQKDEDFVRKWIERWRSSGCKLFK